MSVPDRHSKDRYPEPKALYIGPWYGEFGHELMFVAMARAYAEGYDHVTACSRASSAALYADFADEFIAHDIQCEPAMAGTTHETVPDRKALARWIPPATEADRFPGHVYSGNEPIVSRRYGQQVEREEGLVVVHARNRVKHVPTRNWSQSQWNRLARLMVKEGIAKRVVCVGLPDTARMVEGALDMRDAPLPEQMDILAAAQLAIGPSSGPMHLAQHCGCPVVVWCGGGAAERHRTAMRYLATWNPFHAPACATEYASWNPSVETVWGWVVELLPTLTPAPVAVGE